MARAVLALLLASSLLAAQDEAIRLKNGKMIVGQIVEKNADGFKLEKWDGSGVVAIKWTQISDADRARLQKEAADATQAIKMIDGIRVVTATRIVEGVLVKEEPTNLHVKTKDSKTPIQIPISAILAREKIKLPELDIYTPEERLELKAQSIDSKNPDHLLDLAEFARGLGFADKSREYLNQALAVAPEDRKEAIQLMIKEVDGKKALDEIDRLIENAKFEDAATKAETWLQDFEGTDIAKKNSDIVDRIRKEAEEFQKNRDKVLGKKVVEQFPKLVQNYLKEYAKLDKIDNAMRNAEKASETAIKELKTKYDITDEDFSKWWTAAEKDRSMKKRRVSFGTGTWIVSNGQDGGWDSEDTRTSQDSGGGNPLDQLAKQFGQGGFQGQGNQNKQQKKNQPDPRKKIQTRQEWWETNSPSTRAEFLEAHWVSETEWVKKDKSTEKKCPNCNGTGYLKSLRGNKYVDIVCSRCHTVGKEVDITYY